MFFIVLLSFKRNALKFAKAGSKLPLTTLKRKPLCANYEVGIVGVIIFRTFQIRFEMKPNNFLT